MDKIKKNLKVIISLAAVSIGLIAVQAFQYQDWNHTASVWVFDVGQGDSIFIDSDVQVLIDGGPDSIVIEKLTKILPFWDRSIDLIVNTHPHADHLTGLVEVLRRYLVEDVWLTGQIYKTSFSEVFHEAALDLSTVVSVGDSVTLAEGVSIKVVWPIVDLTGVELDDPNDGSIVLLVECYGTKILLTGDIGVNQELAIMDQVGDIDVLKVGHQGSLTSSDVEFLKTLNPEVAIISVGENDYGHPRPTVIRRLQEIDAAIYRTDQNGDVRIKCSEGGYSVKLYE